MGNIGILKKLVGNIENCPPKAKNCPPTAEWTIKVPRRKPIENVSGTLSLWMTHSGKLSFTGREKLEIMKIVSEILFFRRNPKEGPSRNPISQ